jgi:ketosteroid isomerase-like protein
MTVRDALLRGDFDEMAEALDPEVVWIGVSPGQLCRNRDDVLAIFRRALAAGRRARPEIVEEVEGMLVVDPRVEPPPEFNPQLHQVFVVRDERIVEMRDYPDRISALEAVRRQRS